MEEPPSEEPIEDSKSTNNLTFPQCFKCSLLPSIELNINKIKIKCQNYQILEESIKSYSEE